MGSHDCAERTQAEGRIVKICLLGKMQFATRETCQAAHRGPNSHRHGICWAPLNAPRAARLLRRPNNKRSAGTRNHGNIAAAAGRRRAPNITRRSIGVLCLGSRPPPACSIKQRRSRVSRTCGAPVQSAVIILVVLPPLLQPPSPFPSSACHAPCALAKCAPQPSLPLTPSASWPSTR